MIQILELFSLSCFRVPAVFRDLYGFVIPFRIDYPEVLIPSVLVTDPGMQEVLRRTPFLTLWKLSTFSHPKFIKFPLQEFAKTPINSLFWEMNSPVIDRESQDMESAWGRDGRLGAENSCGRECLLLQMSLALKIPIN